MDPLPPLPSADLPQPRRLDVPARSRLLERYAQAEALGRTILVLEILATLAAAAVWWLRGAPTPGWPAALAFTLGSLGVFRFIPRTLALKKKRLEHLRPDAQFGVHSRDSLVRLSRSVFARLGLPPDAAPVFLIRNKDVNAAAVRCELWPGQRVFNGVFLHRSLLHLLDEAELASVIGHELGHVFPYAPILSRSYLVHAFAAGVSSACLLATFPSTTLAILLPFALVLLLDFLISLPHLRMGRAIEFLCDDFGAQAAGLLPALSSEMKIAAESEVRQSLLLKAFQARQQGAPIPVADLFHAYELAVPFGRADPAAFDREFQSVLRKTRQPHRGLSLSGFLQSLSQEDRTDVDDAFHEEILGLQHTLALPRLPLDLAPFLRGSHAWSPDLARHLADRIRAHPRRVLFRLPHELDDRSSTHPNPSRRLLFLIDHAPR